jgi:pimeloyl-ACP methyl ester carboxylesterase
MKQLLTFFFLALSLSPVHSPDMPSSDAFRVLPKSSEGPRITPYLRYQTEVAWRQDDERRKRWEAIRTEQELLQLQQELRTHLLNMLGGLPTDRTPLHPRITGRIQMKGFHIEKLIFESLPGVYVTALIYVPENGAAKNPAMLVPSGHAANGKVHYQALCQHLVQRGYIVISWDPVGQGERSQFWDAQKHKSRYNLICGEHAVLGNLAYLAGTNLARWEIWDGIRALDYLLTRSDVDPERINITGTSGGGFQTAYIAALDPRIKVAAPSCYITALPMRVYNRIFQDPDSDPEQDLYGAIASGIDHPGLLLLMYPRPVFVAAAVLDFFPIEGTYKTVREVTALYSRFGHADRIAMHEGYHKHEYSDENQKAAIDFMDHFNRMPPQGGLASTQSLDEKALQCTRTGQVMLDFPDARSVMDLIRDYYREHKSRASNLKQLYYSDQYPGIKTWSVEQYNGVIPAANQIAWQLIGSSQVDDVKVDRYVLHHSRYLEMPLLHIYKQQNRKRVLMWLGEDGKIAAHDWPEARKYVDQGYDIVTIDPRGLGETRMRYTAMSADDPTLANPDFDLAYVSPLSSVLADYVYNSLLNGRPYFLQMLEDVEIATRFVHAKVNDQSEIAVYGRRDAYTLAHAASQVLPGIKLLSESDNGAFKWSTVVEGKRELWPVAYLLPDGAYIY